MASSDHSTFQNPFASPNKIPPRTSSRQDILNGNSVRHRPSVLRPLSEIDWMSQSKKSKTSHHSSPSLALPNPASQLSQPTGFAGDAISQQHTTSQTQNQTQNQTQTSQYPTPMTPPPPDPMQGIGDDLIYGKRTMWNDEKERILLGPFDYLLGHPGKDIRSQMIAAFNQWLHVPAEKLEVITRVVGMLHTASLLVDDVEDSSILRRGIPVAHSIFGVAQTINSSNYVYFKALEELARLQNPKLITIFMEEMLNLHRGQGMDLYWRDSLTCPSEEDYLEMVGNKTGGLFRLAIKLMQAESAVDIDCSPLVSTLGLLFQILDDHLNLSPTSGYASLKGLCEDLTEGKFSFPVIHAIRADPSNLVLINILKQKPTDEEVKRYAVKYLEKMGSFEYSRKVIEELTQKSLNLIKGIETGLGDAGTAGGEALRAVVGKLCLR